MHFNIRIEKTVHGCNCWCSIDGVLTPPDRIRLKNDDMLIEGSMALLGGVVESVLDRSSARVKVRDEPLYMDGCTSGLVEREI